MISRFIKVYLLVFIGLTLKQPVVFCQPIPWYHHTSIYQIYPRSFYDSNSDGIGDLNGIIQKLDYIKALGFETIWISPFFLSPQQDFGYDISNYMAISPEYGTMETADELIREVHQRGMKIVFDMVMNHTSVKHVWFRLDEQKKPGKDDFYLWRDKPNNWKSMTGGSGWHYSPIRKQYFYASFLPFQPDLNYHNPVVKQTMLEQAKFWLRKGVDGFRLDIFNVVYKDSLFRNNPFTFKIAPSEKNPDGFFQKMKYNINQPQSMLFAQELRSVCNSLGSKMLLGEVSGPRSTIRQFCGTTENNGLGLVFNFEMLRFKWKASYFHTLIKHQEEAFLNPFMPVYVFSNHDRRRSMTRLKEDVRKAKLLHTLQFLVRGVPCMYYGEEIGMTDFRMPAKNGLDPIAQKMKNTPRFLFDLAGETVNRDELRTPMQWDETTNAGFSNHSNTWLPVNINYPNVNVQQQKTNSNSLLNVVKQLNTIRLRHEAIRFGDLTLLDQHYLPNGVLGFYRKFGKEELLILMNFKDKPVRFSIQTKLEKIWGLFDTDGVNHQGINLNGCGAVILRVQ